jgi:hypothetical protein
MNRAGLAIILVSISFMSCMEKQQVLTKADMKAKVDSIVNTKLPDINRMVQEDLDYRSAIEVKVKADSIVQAKQKHSSTDTSKKAR